MAIGIVKMMIANGLMMMTMTITVIFIFILTLMMTMNVSVFILTALWFFAVIVNNAAPGWSEQETKADFCFQISASVSYVFT